MDKVTTLGIDLAKSVFSLAFTFTLKLFAVRSSLILQAAAFRLSVLPGAGRGRRPSSGFERATLRNPAFFGARDRGAWRLLQQSMKKESL